MPNTRKIRKVAKKVTARHAAKGKTITAKNATRKARGIVNRRGKSKRGMGRGDT